MSNHKGIQTEDWFPSHAPLDYPDDFVAWIDSLLTGWRNRIEYKPFETYKKQSEVWLRDTDTITDYHDEDEQEDFIIREYMRCRDNSLYASDKYGYLKEGEVAEGEIKFKAWEAQSIILFLTDCKYSQIIGKGRQIGFTSTLGLLADARINFRKSYFVKFITHNKLKGEEIFKDKIKYSFGRYPDWLKNEVSNDRDNILALQSKGKKGEVEGAMSRAEVVTPAVDAINGGSPNLVLIDEIGLMEIFSDIMKEGRPALFFYNPANGKMEMRRQVIAWGTGGEMDKGGAVFEVEFKLAIQAWRDRNFSYGIIPLFFDCFARQGMTEEIYEQEKKVYYSVTGVKADAMKVRFHQHYPITIDDMFLRKAATIVPIAMINHHIMKIHALQGDDMPQYGYFEPIFNEGHPTPEDDVPFKISGSTFIPTTGMDDERTTSVVFRHPPEEIWEYRWYEGTDPINSETGKSKMSSAIWDSLSGSVSCVVNWRVKTFKECYLQCLLAGLYYDQGTGTLKELVESNIGDMYVDYLEQKGFGNRLAANADLPKFLQTPTSKWWGISNRVNTAGKIINNLLELIESHRNSIFILWFWLQLKTFVEKALKGGGSSLRQSRYQAADLKYDFDDVIFSVDFAYICAKSFDRFEPQEQKGGKEGNDITTRYVQNAETNWIMRLAQVNSKGEVVKYLGRR